MAPVFEKVWECEGPSACEAPHWDAQAQCLYFVDLVGCKAVRYDPANNKATSAAFGEFLVICSVTNQGNKDLCS